MSRLKMRTKTDPQPRQLNFALCRNLSRVYFSAHPADYVKYLDALAKELYRTHDCAFCFDVQPDQPYDEDTLADLEQMHLFILPITTRLLTDPAGLRALEQDLAIAKEHHIPVLPLMREEGLEYLYSQTAPLKNLQFLSPYDKSEAALPYANKLRAMLDATLLDPQTAEEVRAAFPARIFLSYRKKDRKLAQDLRQTIHARNVLRDVAIWYDEFLTPGEDFNQNIRQVLEETHLFTLAVTDHLLEAGNYVIRHEYPAALELDKPVLPVEVSATDREAFSRTFLVSNEEDMQKKINELVQPMADLSSELQETVQRSLEEALKHPLTENNDPHHLYQMGMAYLHGVDVELDRERARELLLAAAKQQDVWAMMRLAEMYQTDAAACRMDAAAAEACRKQSESWAEKVVDYYDALYNAGDRRKELIRARLYAKNALAAKFMATKHAGEAAYAWPELWDILQAEHTEYPWQEDPGFFSQVYYHAAMEAFCLRDTSVLPKSRQETVREYMDRSIQLAALQEADDPAAQKKLLLKRYVAAGEFFARMKEQAAAEEYFSKACGLYPDANKLEDRETLGQLTHALFRQAVLQGRMKGNQALQTAETLLRKIPAEEKTAGDWHLQSKLRMHQALGQFLILDRRVVKNQGTRNKMKARVELLLLSARSAAQRCVEQDGSTLTSRENRCQILQESITLYFHLKNTAMIQQCGAELRELADSLQACTGQKNLLKHLSDSFVALARLQRVMIAQTRDVRQAEALLKQGLQDCQRAEDLLQGYEKRGGAVALLDPAGMKYARGLLYQAAGRHEDALPWFEAACGQLADAVSRSPDENSLLKWCEKEVNATRKMLKREPV